MGGRIVVAIILFKKDIDGGQNEEDYMAKNGLTINANPSLNIYRLTCKHQKHCLPLS